MSKELTKDEKIVWLMEIRNKLDEPGKNKGINTEDLEFLYKEATNSVGFISFRGILTGSAYKKARNGYWEVKFDTGINPKTIAELSKACGLPVQVTIDPTDGQKKLVNDQGLPIEDVSELENNNPDLFEELQKDKPKSKKKDEK